MSSFLFKWLTIAFAGVLLSSMVSMVGAFFGWMGNELRDLLQEEGAGPPDAN